MDAPGLLPLLSSAVFWLLVSVLVGLLANQLPPRWLQDPDPRPQPEGAAAAALRPTARAGRGPTGIRIWKRWIPDAGGVLPGGVRKANLVRRNPQALQRLVIETRRAELVHWLLWPAALLTTLWLPPAGVIVNLVFASLFNLPCVLVQRHNRARLHHCLARLAGGGRFRGPAAAR